MKKKLCLLMALICCVAVFAVAFAACNDNGGSGGSGGNGGNGGNGGGTGDVIFTDDATFDEILTKLQNADNYTFTQHFYDDVYDTSHRARLTKNSCIEEIKIIEESVVDRREVYGFMDAGKYYHLSMMCDFDNMADTGSSLVTDENAVIDFNEKSLEKYGYQREAFDMYIDVIFSKLTADEQGKLVLSPDVIDNYDNTYVRLEGDRLVLGFTSSDISYEYVISHVNATAVEIPGEVKALAAEAEWAEYIYYNGVEYQKLEDENGEEYYVPNTYDESAALEETINTLPVRERW